jgi:hypothetical protein
LDPLIKSQLLYQLSYTPVAKQARLARQIGPVHPLGNPLWPSASTRSQRELSGCRIAHGKAAAAKPKGWSGILEIVFTTDRSRVWARDRVAGLVIKDTEPSALPAHSAACWAWMRSPRERSLLRAAR